MKRSRGFRRKTRYAFRKEVCEHGKISMRSYFQPFTVGDKVYLHVDPSVQKGMYFPKFLGRSGTVSGKKGSCYEVSITDGGKEKMLLVHPIHLKKA